MHQLGNIKALPGKKYLLCLLLFSIVIVNARCNKNVPAAAELTVAPQKPTVFNLGIGGNTSLDLLHRIDTVINLHPDLVIIMVGANDATPGTPTFNSYSGNLAAIIDTIKSYHVAVMLLTPTPIISKKKKRREEYLSVLRGEMDSVGNANNCYLIDMNSIFIKDSSSITSLYSEDGIHPNSNGYALIAQSIYAYLMSENVKVLRIVCFGDSITLGIGSDTSYPAILQNLLTQ